MLIMEGHSFIDTLSTPYSTHLCLALVRGLVFLHQLSAELQTGVVRSLLQLQELLQVLDCQPFHLGAVLVEEHPQLGSSREVFEESAEFIKVEFPIELVSFRGSFCVCGL